MKTIFGKASLLGCIGGLVLAFSAATPAQAEEGVCALKIMVVDSDERPVTHADVSARIADGSMSKSLLLPDGTYFVDGVGEKVTLEIDHPEFGELSVDFRVPANEPLVSVEVFASASGATVRVNGFVPGPGTMSPVPPNGAQASGPGGGEDCASATAIGGLPFSDTGSTAGALDDYDELCPFNTPGSPDVVYSYTPGSDQLVNISLCANSDYDTKLYVYENACGAYQGGTAIACNDDACSTPSFPSAFVSSLSAVPMMAGNTYYIVVDGYNLEAGNYTIDMEELVASECPMGGIEEFEPDCGTPVDTTNGGCNSDPPVFEDIACNDTFCGSNGAGGGTRDTDWFKLVLDSDSQVTWEGQADHNFLIGIVDNGGVDSCAGVSAFLEFATAGAGQMASVTACLPAGTWYLFAAPSEFEGVACQSDYTMTVSCEGCVVPTGACCFADGGCEDGLAESVCVASGGDYQGDDSDCFVVVCVPTCGPGAGSCFVDNGTPGCDDTECCLLICSIDPFCCDVEWDGICADQALAMCGGAPTTGACCLIDGSCLDDQTVEQCDLAGGEFQGLGTLCNDVFCPVVPDNDLCENAEPLDVPGTVMAATAGATFDDVGTCGTSNTAAGVWYSVMGTGTTMTATTCGDFFDYDTKISVFCGSCDGLTCVDGNDDDCADGASGLLSTVTWCGQAGAEYLILVHGFASAEGQFELTVSEDGMPCTPGVFCIPTGACCVDDLCSNNVTEADCTAAGGAYQGDGTVCEGGFLGYSLEECASEFVDISGIGIEAPTASNSDDGGDVVPLGFSFNFFGNTYTDVGVSSNGYLTFGSDLTDFSNDAIPNTLDPNDLIAPYWDDWSPNNGGTVVYQTFANPTRFMAQWTDVPHFTGAGNATFQVILFADTNCIMYRYADPLTFVSPTVGVENSDGTDGLAADETLIGPGSCLILCPSFTDPIVCEVVEPEDCCVNSKKLQSITLRYTGDDCSAGNNDQDGKAECEDLTGDPLPNCVYIVASKKKCTSLKDKHIYFEGEVCVGDEFEVSSLNLPKPKKKLKSKTYICVFDANPDDGGQLLQTIKIRTNCKEELFTLDQFGSVMVTGCQQEQEPIAADTCPEGDPRMLVLQYTSDDCGYSMNAQDKSKCDDYSLDSLPRSAYIVASAKKECDEDIYFAGTVKDDGIFLVDAITLGEIKLASDLYICIHAHEGGELLQRVKIHTSCSNPVIPGDQFGTLFLLATQSENDPPGKFHN